MTAEPKVLVFRESVTRHMKRLPECSEQALRLASMANPADFLGVSVAETADILLTIAKIKPPFPVNPTEERRHEVIPF